MFREPKVGLPEGTPQITGSIPTFGSKARVLEASDQDASRHQSLV